jgi:hypothetical protein
LHLHRLFTSVNGLVSSLAPAGLVSDPAAYNAWFREKVKAALDDPTVSSPSAGDE